MKYDVVALGELLIDFTIDGKSSQGNNTYEANPGGAPCNVLAMLNRMNKKTAFIGKVGKDAFGQILKSTIDKIGIDSKGLVFDEKVRQATKKAVQEAKKENILISFDPNLRELLWEDLSLAKEQIDYGCSVCDILKIEVEDLMC